MELKLHERIILIVYYLILYSAPVMIVVNIMEKYEHGKVIGAIVGFLFFYLWVNVIHLKERIKGKEFRERHENICNSCKYKQENDK